MTDDAPRWTQRTDLFHIVAVEVIGPRQLEHGRLDTGVGDHDRCPETAAVGQLYTDRVVAFDDDLLDVGAVEHGASVLGDPLGAHLGDTPIAARVVPPRGPLGEVLKGDDRLGRVELIDRHDEDDVGLDAEPAAHRLGQVVEIEPGRERGALQRGHRLFVHSVQVAHHAQHLGDVGVGESEHGDHAKWVAAARVCGAHHVTPLVAVAVDELHHVVGCEQLHLALGVELCEQFGEA